MKTCVTCKYDDAEDVAKNSKLEHFEDNQDSLQYCYQLFLRLQVVFDEAEVRCSQCYHEVLS